jgi:hypothetical protein
MISGTFEHVGVGLAELLAPGPDGLVGDDHPAFGHQLLDLPQTQREPVVQPHAVANDLHRVAVTRYSDDETAASTSP